MFDVSWTVLMALHLAFTAFRIRLFYQPLVQVARVHHHLINCLHHVLLAHLLECVVLTENAQKRIKLFLFLLQPQSLQFPLQIKFLQNLMLPQWADLFFQPFNYLLFLVHLFKLLHFLFTKLNFKKHGH